MSDLLFHACKTSMNCFDMADLRDRLKRQLEEASKHNWHSKNRPVAQLLFGSYPVSDEATLPAIKRHFPGPGLC